ncbi:uncharacterized protein SPSK_00176 [Sporothrix schenckii 1099-18]|nr:uncharacterized protein SPSK_00176 [Sporothrix schenckii 1099-18]KJR83719.1 hypothetical protein SPSK_00176 [Sporothrix schenckii 1099-18]
MLTANITATDPLNTSGVPSPSAQGRPKERGDAGRRTGEEETQQNSETTRSVCGARNKAGADENRRYRGRSFACRFMHVFVVKQPQVFVAFHTFLLCTPSLSSPASSLLTFANSPKMVTCHTKAQRHNNNSLLLHPQTQHHPSEQTMPYIAALTVEQHATGFGFGTPSPRLLWRFILAEKEKEVAEDDCDCDCDCDWAQSAYDVEVQRQAESAV